jgi:DNA primase
VVEGFFAAMHLHQAGFPTVVALMGSSMSEEQITLLVNNFSHVSLLLDRNDAGIAGAMDIVQRLVHYVFVHMVWLPDGKSQPEELSNEELTTLLLGAVEE